jgi:hypothetical protein
MGQNARTFNRFSYFAEDCDCRYCRYYRGKNRFRENVCGRDVCCCEDIRSDAARGGRIKRKPGWNK